MRAFFDIFQLELRALSRSWSLAMLSAASAAWMLAVPRLVVGDGTAEGTRELVVHFSLGGVFALLVVALLASAAGSIARERDAKRFAELRESLTRLVKNEDFRSWFGYIDWQLCGEETPTSWTEAFTQGKRATMGFLKDSLAIAEGGPEFLADLTRRHFSAVANTRIEAQRAKNENGE